MSPLRLLACLLLLVIRSANFSSAADSASVSGTVRDSDGNPLANVTMTLAGRSTQQAISDSSGRFRFAAALPPGDYALSAVLTGYAASGPLSIHLQSAPFNADIVLGQAPAPPLEFQSSGIRGLIDPGGYSASIATASTGVLHGIAELRRKDTSFATSTAKDWPCVLEPQLRQAAAQHPDQPETSLRLGQFYVAHDQPSQALPPLQHALALDSANESASRTLAAAWLEAGNFDAALKLLKRLLVTRDTSELHQLLARADEGSGLFPQAAQEYRVAVALLPSEESSFGIGYELLLSGSLANAAAAFTEGITRYPKSVSMQIGAGTTRFLQGDIDAALQNFLTATDIDPADPRPYSFLATSAAASTDQRGRVHDTFKRYLALDSHSANANYFYALALARAYPPGNAAQIEALLMHAIQLDSALAKAHQQLADSYFRRNDFADAVSEYKTALRLTHDPEPHYHLALAYKRMGRAADSDREMQLFRQSREVGGQASAAFTGIDLAQFISATGAPRPHSGLPLQCP